MEVAGSGSLVVAAPEAPPELPLPRWLYLRDGRLVHDGPPAPEVEAQPDEALA
jgi:phospholipid/cholesterol/gamma-HCH transport system ATP-binding protein